MHNGGEVQWGIAICHGRSVNDWAGSHELMHSHVPWENLYYGVCAEMYEQG
jgi:hypothetical protein